LVYTEQYFNHYNITRVTPTLTATSNNKKVKASKWWKSLRHRGSRKLILGCRFVIGKPGWEVNIPKLIIKMILDKEFIILMELKRLNRRKASKRDFTSAPHKIVSEPPDPIAIGSYSFSRWCFRLISRFPGNWF